MKVAVLVPAAGSSSTLATTAFTGALMEGFSTIGVSAQVFGLTFNDASWVPDALGECAASAPWLPPARYRLGDRAEATRRGIFDEMACDSGPWDIRWHPELLLERGLLEFAPEGRDHVVLAMTLSAPQLRMASRVATRLGWRLVVFSNEALTDVQIDPSTRDDYIRCVTRCAAGIWSVSETLSAFWKSLGVPDERILVSPCVVRSSSFAKPGAPRRSSSATYLGNLAHREIGYLLDIAAATVATVPEFNLTIYGDALPSVRQDLARIASERGLGAVVCVEPPVSPVDVPGVLATSDVLLLPRSQGKFSAAGFPNKLAEYLASGRPVVVTRVGDIPRYLTDGESAFLVPPDDTSAFVAALVRVVRDPELGDAVGARGREVAARLLRADVVARQLADFMHALPPAPGCAREAQGSSAMWRRLVAMRPDTTPVKRVLSRAARALGVRPPTQRRTW